MASNKKQQHTFRNKLLLNQWMISLFGIDPLIDNRIKGKIVRPFVLLSNSIKDAKLEGLDNDNLHHFYHALVGDCNLFGKNLGSLTKDQILGYEENIVRHTQFINSSRKEPIVWKYFQWLTLLFTEIYLDRFFGNKALLLQDLNNFVVRYNEHWKDYTDIPLYEEDDLNKLCLQNATGSGKTLVMHVNLMQYMHYSKLYGKDKDFSRIILLTPNERLSEQHRKELEDSQIDVGLFAKFKGGQMGLFQYMKQVDILEITKLGDKEGPNTIEARSLGSQNLLLVDEGHRGLSGKDAKKNENAWYKNRAMLCEKGFAFEYSATFEQAVSGTGHEDDYAKAVLFDYSYRWFYEDGFGKDYQILNLPESYSEVQSTYLTACLLKFYQQLCIYENNKAGFTPFNIEKPLWVFVGSTVSKKSGSKEVEEPGEEMLSDIGLIIWFIAGFLNDQQAACRRIKEILCGNGQSTGLMDKNGIDIFEQAFDYLRKEIKKGKTETDFYKDILYRLFNNVAGGHLVLKRTKGDSGEVALYAGASEIPFGLINVGKPKELCDHVSAVVSQNGISLSIEDSDFSEAIFSTVKESKSPINLLIGSKKFVEGWDCWRVSTMGLMHVGKSEGSQIIQLFGRGVRLKGYDMSLKRSTHCQLHHRPDNIEEIETLYVFGIAADFMEKFRKFLVDEGLPGNERRVVYKIPLNITYDFGKKLKIVRPKKKHSTGREYDFKKDGPVPLFGDLPHYVAKNQVVVDWYPRIQALQSRGAAVAALKDTTVISSDILAFIDFDTLYFEMERYKRERNWYNLNISKEGIYKILHDNSWYILYLPKTRLQPSNFEGIRLIQQVSLELLKRYCEHFYNYCKRSFIEPRLEIRELVQNDDNLPEEEKYTIIVDGDEIALINSIEEVKDEIKKGQKTLIKTTDLDVCIFEKHLFQPLFHVKGNGKISIKPVALNESEYDFVTDLKLWCEGRKAERHNDESEIFLLRNLSTGRGVGFFEAGNFHPDFILWVLKDNKQYVTFIEPHGLMHEGPGSAKIQFHKTIKDIEKRLGDPSVILNCFILSWTKYPQLNWGLDKSWFTDQNVLFMVDDRDEYLNMMFDKIL